jgi:transcriptional regulator with XRE-family HTH domain
MTMSNADLGCAVRRLRRARRVTIETLAFAAEMHPTYLSGIERGERNPSWEKITSLARALNLPVSQLAREVEDESEVAQAVRETRARLLAESTQRGPAT